jgi:hypothetical protein
MHHTQNAVTIILGEKQCGKTALARKLSESKKTVWLSYHYLDGFGLSPIDETTELIVIDGAASISEIKRFITQPMLVIERKGQSPKTLPRPKTIVVSNAFKAHQFSNVLHAHIVILSSRRTGKSSFLNGLKHLFTSNN